MRALLVFGNMTSTENVGSKAALWTAPNEHGYSYCDWGRCSREEPTVILGLTQTKGSRRKDSNFNYYVVESKYGGWRVSRKQRTDVDTTQPVTPTIPPVTEQKTLATTPPRPPAFTDTQATNGTKEQTIQDRINQSHLENISCWSEQAAAIREQTTAIREQTKQIGDLVGVVWELIQKGLVHGE
jgi:hypothetical protein